MEEISTTQEIDELTPDSKLFGMPRRLVGAFIGILVFLLLSLIAWFTEWKYLAFILFSPYYLITLLFSRFIFSLSPFEHRLFLFLTSGIPPVLIGSLLFSEKRKERVRGFSFFWIYLLISLAFGVFISFVASILD